MSASEPNYKKLGKQFVKEMGKGYWATLRMTAEAGHSISAPDRTIRSNDDLIRYKRHVSKHGGADKPILHPGADYGYRLKCKGTCCWVHVSEDSLDSSYGEGMAAGTLDGFCFWPVSATEAYIDSIALSLDTSAGDDDY